MTEKFSRLPIVTQAVWMDSIPDLSDSKAFVLSTLSYHNLLQSHCAPKVILPRTHSGCPNPTFGGWQFLQSFYNLTWSYDISVQIWVESFKETTLADELVRMPPPAAVYNQQPRAGMLVPKGWKAGLSQVNENFWLPWYQSSFQKWWKQAHIAPILWNLILYP